MSDMSDSVAVSDSASPLIADVGKAWAYDEPKKETVLVWDTSFRPAELPTRNECEFWVA